MSEYILEILVEDLPPSHLKIGLEQLKSKFEEELEKNRIEFEKIETIGTKRRLVVSVIGISESQKSEEEVILGPSKKIAYDENGEPTKAAIGFARSKGKDVEELEIIETPKGEYVGLKILKEKKETIEILKKIIHEIIDSISFPKNMKWNETGVLFSRPIRGFLSLFDKKIVNFEYANLEASNRTRGHRILADDEEITISKVSKYEESLKSNHVILRKEDRLSIIQSEIKKIEEELDIKIVKNEELLNELVDMVEHPVAFTGTFSDEYLKIPFEIIEIFLKQEKRLFLTRNQLGELIGRFIGVADASEDAKPYIVKGFERVVRATLEDAKFFWENDLKLDLDQLFDELKGYSFEKKLGTYYDKTLRMESLAEEMIKDSEDDFKEKIKKAVKYSKVDQLTEMVKEFPALQGIMGGLYLKERGEDEVVWKAVYEQYKPQNLEDSIPSIYSGKILSLADRLDSLIGAFIIGMEVSGDKDPFGLRRLGNTIVKLLIEGELDFELLSLFEKSLNLYDNIEKSKEDLAATFLDFMEQRFRFYCTNFKNIDYDVLNAVLKTGFSNIYLDFQRAFSVQRTKQNENFRKLIISYKRVKNIVKGKEKFYFNEEGLVEKEEKALFDIFKAVEEEVLEEVKRRNFLKAEEILITLRPFIDAYFDSVMVMVEDEELKNNRIAMLQRISSLFEKIADFNEIIV